MTHPSEPHCKCHAGLIFLLGLLPLLYGCPPRPLGAGDQTIFDQAQADLEAGRLTEAESRLSALIKANGDCNVLSELYYLRGVVRQKQGRDAEARHDFRLGATSRGIRKTQIFSAVALANMDFEAGRDASAISLYRQAIEIDMSDLPNDVILLRLGVALQRQGQWAEADDVLSQLISQHPRSPLAAQAQQRFQATAFTVQAGLFTNRSNADSLAANLRSRGFPVSQTVTVSSGRTAYLVNVGRLRTFAEARQMAQRLQAAGVEGVIKP